MKLIILAIVSLTNFYTGFPHGDQLDVRGLPLLETFGKYYLSFSFNSAFVNEYRYQYLYDSYNNTVGKQITYERRNYYLLRPNIFLGYSLWHFKTYFYFRGVADLNYVYEKILYNSSYLVEDTIRIERKGDIFESGLAVSVGFLGFHLTTGVGLLNKSLPSNVQRSLRPVTALSYFSKPFGASIQLLTKVKFPEESNYSLPHQFVISGYYNPAVKSGAKVDFELLYKPFSQIDTSLNDYWVGTVGISHTFRDMTFLRVSGVLEKSFVNENYVPGFDLSVGYKMAPFYFGVNLSKNFISYSQGSELIEENPFKIRFDVKIVN